MLKFITNIWRSPRSTAQGAVEAAILGGGGSMLVDPQSIKLVALLALWRFLKGILSADVRKVVDDVLEADRK